MEKIIEIITILMSELKEKKDLKKLNTDRFIKSGYTKSEISAAFSWIADKIEDLDETQIKEFSDASYSVRILHPAESSLFTAEAMGELVQLQFLKILSSDQFETLIEKAMLSPYYQIDKNNLYELLQPIMFSASSESENKSSRTFLTGTESIN